MKPINDTMVWDQCRGKIFSKKGGWKIGSGVFSHGYSMMDDLVGEVSYTQVQILNAVGTLPEKRVADWIEAVCICLSWPDPRIWCNQIGALGGTARTSVVAATVSGVLAADSTMYGSRPLLKGVEFIQKALKQKQSLSISAEEIVQRVAKKNRGKATIVGYARPIASGDERVVAMERVTNQLGFEIGEHLHLAYEINEILTRDHRESININGYVSAFLSDQGYSADQIYNIGCICVSSGVTACYVDAADRVAGSFLPLRCDDVDYQGKPPRTVPDNKLC